MKNSPTAITVPNTTRKFCEESLKLRKPTMSVNIATTSAADVRTVHVLIALVLASAGKSAIVALPSVSEFTSSSRYRSTTWSP